MAVMASSIACAPTSARTATSPCGEPRAAGSTPPTVSAPAIGEVVAVVVMPWEGTSYVTLDGAAADEAHPRENRFHFRGVTAGRHILISRALGFEPIADTIQLSDHAGLSVWIRPQRAAVCRGH